MRTVWDEKRTTRDAALFASLSMNLQNCCRQTHPTSQSLCLPLSSLSTLCTATKNHVHLPQNKQQTEGIFHAAKIPEQNALRMHAGTCAAEQCIRSRKIFERGPLPL
jgi:hypothetical protein